jgi:hypothetical protein
MERLWHWIGREIAGAQTRDEWRRFLEDRAGRQRACLWALAVGAAVLLAWPTARALPVGHGPFTYTAAGTLAVLIVAYLGFVGGVRTERANARFTVQQWAAWVPLAPGTYLIGTAAGRLLGPLFFLAVTFPLLLPAAALEGATGWPLAAGLAVMIMTALTGRMASLAMLLWLERSPAWLAAAAHPAMWTPFLLGWVWPPLSPLAAFYGTVNGDSPAAGIAPTWAAFLATHAAVNLALYGLCLARVRTLRRRAGAFENAPGPAEAAAR